MQSSIKLHAGPPAPLGADRISKPIHAPARFPAGLRFEGYGAFDCDVAVDGEVHGTLNLERHSLLQVSVSGSAEGTFRAGHARIEGRVSGEIDCSNGAVDFTETARCQVKVLYSELSVARGADIEADLHRVTEAAHG